VLGGIASSARRVGALSKRQRAFFYGRRLADVHAGRCAAAHGGGDLADVRSDSYVAARRARALRVASPPAQQRSSPLVQVVREKVVPQRACIKRYRRA